MNALNSGELTPDFEGRYYSPKMQWWCMHMHLTDDRNQEWGVYFWPALGSLDEAWILSFHSRNELINFTQVHLPLDTLSAARDGVDVRFGNQFLRGRYPNYHVCLGGMSAGKSYLLDLSCEAETNSFRAVKALRGIDWNYVPRMRASGTLLVGDERRTVKGYSYYERRRGRFWAPGVRLGIWESVPLASKEGFSIPLFYKVWKNDDTPQLQTLSFTADGKTLVEFPKVDVEVLETRKFPGFEDIDHPMRYTIVATGPAGKAELEVTRFPNRLMMRNYFNEPDRKANATGMYGTGRTRGTVVVDGKSYAIDGDSYGSALFFSALK